MRKALIILVFLILIETNIIIAQTEAVEIKAVLPNKPPILIPMDFSVVLDKAQSNLTYTWNFGDGSGKIITKSGILSHAYPRKGIYELEIKISGLDYEINKTFEIDAISPKDYIISMIEMYRTDLATIERQKNLLPEWIQNEINKSIKIKDLNSSIYEQEQRYKNATSDDEYTDITKKLLELKIPFSFSLSEETNSAECFLNENQFDLESLSDLGAGTVSGSREDNFEAIESWAVENIDILVESKSYSFYFRNKSIQNLFSHVQIKLKPLKKIDKLFFAINGDSEKIILKNISEIKQNLGSSAGIIFNKIDREKNIEIIYPEKINLLQCPFYFSPDFKELKKNNEIIICNNDGLCDNKENYKTCNDCKQFKITFMLLIILLISALAVYILMQEWYKRYYELKLFPNRNSLYNVMSFINNSINQGLKKSEIFEKLKKMDWNAEQLSYAWNKFHGKRTGMFEIPVFKFLEKRKIVKELENRNTNYIYR